MRKEMLTILTGLDAIRYDGPLPAFGFTLDECYEVAIRDTDKRKLLESVPEPPKTLSGERAKMLVNDGVILPEEAIMLRKNYLDDEFRKLKMEEIFLRQGIKKTIIEWRESWIKGMKENKAKQNRLKEEYTITELLFKPEYASQIKTVDIKQRVDEVKSRYIIFDFVSSVRHGFILCPFHSEKSPSCHITKEFFHCFGCGESGDLITFLMKTKSLSFNQVLEQYGTMAR